MANVTIVYTAKRRLLAGVTAGDLVQLDLKITDFERTTMDKKNEVETLGGVVVTSLYNFHDRYEVSTGIIAPADQPALDQFGYSVLGGELFTVTNPDEADRLMEVKLVGRPRRSRAGKGTLNQFRYQYTFREVIG